MSKHTPGPWIVYHDGPSRPIILCGDNSMLSISRWIDGKFTTYENEEADAQLIAASPDLLAACKLALEDSSSDYERYDLRSETIVALTKAIMKAEGKDRT